MDPDLGIGLEDPQALQKYYELLLDIMRVVVSCVLSRGPQNRQAIDAGKMFLIENRNIAVTVFKRNAGIGGKNSDQVGDLKQLADMFVLLFGLTRFIEVRTQSRMGVWRTRADRPDRMVTI